MKEKSPWSEAHITLKRLWDERVAPTGMSQEEFGEKFDIGTQGMVSQYLLGRRPLNYDAAAKFARGFNCSIEDICPEMAQTLSQDIFTVLRRSPRRRRIAVLALFAIPLAFFFTPQNADASILHNFFSEYALHAIRRWLRWLFSVTALGLAAACATHSPEAVTVTWIRVAQADIDKVCATQHGAGAIVLGHYRGCSRWSRDERTCTIWAPDSNEKLGMSAATDRQQREVMASIGHELKHCFDGPWH